MAQVAYIDPPDGQEWRCDQCGSPIKTGESCPKHPDSHIHLEPHTSLTARQIAEQGDWTATATIDAIWRLLMLLETEDTTPTAAMLGVAILIGQWEGKGRRA